MNIFLNKLFRFLLLNVCITTVIIFMVLGFKPLDNEYGAYDIFPKKLSLLDNSNSIKKSAIIGGSAVRFGVDTKLLNNDSVVYYNFGMYAGYGIEPYKYMIDNIKNDVDEIIIMFEDDLYFMKTNKGDIQEFQFLKSNLNYLLFEPEIIFSSFEYFIFQSKLFFKSIVGFDTKTPDRENIKFLIDDYGNLKLGSLSTKKDFIIYHDQNLESQDNFDDSLLDFFNNLKDNENIKLKFSFSPILSNPSSVDLVEERREFLKNIFSNFDWINYNSIYTKKKCFFNSRYHLTTDEKNKFSLLLKSKINSLNN